jgi:hypothetical protein
MWGIVERWWRDEGVGEHEGGKSGDEGLSFMLRLHPLDPRMLPCI